MIRRMRKTTTENKKRGENNDNACWAHPVRSAVFGYSLTVALHIIQLYMKHRLLFGRPAKGGRMKAPLFPSLPGAKSSNWNNITSFTHCAHSLPRLCYIQLAHTQSIPQSTWPICEALFFTSIYKKKRQVCVWEGERMYIYRQWELLLLNWQPSI